MASPFPPNFSPLWPLQCPAEATKLNYQELKAMQLYMCMYTVVLEVFS